MPLGGASIYPTWRVQHLRRLAGPVFTPLGGASIYAAWRSQYLSRLAVAPAFISLGHFSIERKGQAAPAVLAGFAESDAVEAVIPQQLGASLDHISRDAVFYFA